MGFYILHDQSSPNTSTSKYLFAIIYERLTDDVNVTRRSGVFWMLPVTLRLQPVNRDLWNGRFYRIWKFFWRCAFIYLVCLISDSTASKVPAHAQRSMCGENMPLLGGAIPSYEAFLAKWSHMSSSTTHPQLAPFIFHGLQLAKQYYERIKRSHAFLFSMCE